MASGGDFTRRLLVDAGLRPGMRVLDVGCGWGEVTLLAAELVGATGSVIGIDRNEGALATARERAAGSTAPPPAFEIADIHDLPASLGQFDAITGRRVLMYQPDTLAAARSLAGRLREGGVLVLQELDMAMVPASTVPLPLHERALGWLRGMIAAEGADLRMGFNLHPVLTGAGLTVAEVRAEAIVQTPDSPGQLGQIIAAVLPRLVEAGVATAAEVDVQTLQARLDAEREATGATYIGDMMFGAWARKATRGGAGRAITSEGER